MGSAGLDSINHRTNFSSALHKLCVTTHKLFDKYLENETEVEQYDFSNEDSLVPYELSDVCMLALYIENCLIFIKTMML